MPRLTLADIRQSGLPGAIGLCADNTPSIAAAVNEAQERLINAGGRTGWWGGWSSLVFSVSSANPYITLPRQFSTLIGLTICNYGIRLHNQFYEVLPNGIGMQPQQVIPNCWQGNIAGYERSPVATMIDLPGTSYLRAYISDVRDVGAKMLLTGLDGNGLQIYSTLGIDSVNGAVLTFAQPFVQSTFTMSVIQAVQKDITYGDVVLSAIDVTTGAETILSRYAPTEVNPSYRRFLISQLPTNCCPSGTPATSTTTQVKAVGKWAHTPVYLDTDQLVIQCLPALIEMCISIRFSRMDKTDALAMAEQKRAAAIRELQNELRSYLGEQSPAVNVDRFGTAKLEYQSIGNLI